MIRSGSACDFETQLMIAKEIKYIPLNEADVLITMTNDVQKMLYGLMKSLS
jgi:four helix bundle protein